MKRFPGSLIIVLLAATIPAALQAAPPAKGLGPPQRIPPVLAASNLTQGEAVTIASVPREVRRAVVKDAARKFRVAEDAVVLTNAEQVTWSDGSLGCPQKGQQYIQVLVAGYRLVAKTAAGELTYHTDSRGHAVNCASALPGAHAKSLSEALPRPKPAQETTDR